MNKVIKVNPLDNYQLELWFASEEHWLFDMTPYLEKGIFTQLKDITLFNQAFVAYHTVCWPHELDISPETLYLRSQPINTEKSVD